MIKSASQSSLLNDKKYTSMLAGSVPSNEYLITTVTLASNTPVIEFDVSQYAGIYKHLLLVSCLKSDRVAETEGVVMRFNNDTGANYSGHNMENFAGTAAANGSSSGTFIGFGSTGATISDYYPGGEILIMDAFSTVKNKTTFRIQGAYLPTYPNVGFGSGLWVNSSTPISTIKLTPSLGTNFLATSRVSLYGVTA